MFEAGQKSGINEYLKGITSWEDCFQLAQFLLIKMTREGIDMNASELVLSVEMNHEKLEIQIPDGYPVYQGRRKVPGRKSLWISRQDITRRFK